MDLNNLSRRDFLRLSGVSIAVSTLGPISGCLDMGETGISLAYQPPAIGQQAPYLVMINENYPEEYEFGLNTTECTYGAEVVQNYLEGGIDIGQAGEFPSLTAIKNNPDTTIIGNYMAGKQILALAVRADADFGLEDLEGKTIALPLGSTAEWFIREVIKSKTDLTPEDVEFKNSDPQAAVISLSQGTDDAAVLWHPWIERAEKEVGIETISWGFDTDYYLFAPIFARNDYLEENEEEVQKYMDARVRAMKYTYNNIDQVAEWMSEAESGQVEKDVAKRSLEIVLGRTEVTDENALQPWHSEASSILQRAIQFRREEVSPDFPEIDISDYIESKYTENAIDNEAPDLFGDIEF